MSDRADSTDRAESVKTAERSRKQLKDLPRWVAVTSIALGVCIFAFAFYSRDQFGSANEYHLAFAAGLGLVFWGVGSSATGSFLGWSLGGAAAVTLAFFSALRYLAPEPVPDPAIIAHVEGDILADKNVFNVQLASGERLLGAWLEFGNGPRSFRFRIERKHAQKTCLSFSLLENLEDDPFTLYTDARVFEKMFDRETDRIEDGAINLEFRGKTLFVIAQDETAIGFPSCTQAMRGGAILNNPERDLEIGLETRRGLLDGIIPTASAASKSDVPVGELIERLHSKNALIRQDARLRLTRQGSAVMRPVMDALAENPEVYQLKLGVTVVLAEILGAGSDAGKIRAQLTDRDIDLLVPLMARSDETVRQHATAAMVLLADPRAAKASIDILRGASDANGKYNVALFLNSTFETYDEPLKKKLHDGVVSLEKELELGQRTREMLVSVLNFRTTKSAVVTGWAYVGVNFGKGWEERLFSWDGDDKRMPGIGDILTAKGNVNLRKNYIQYEPLDGGWVNAAAVRLIRKGQKVEVTAVKSVAFGYHWVQVELK